MEAFLIILHSFFVKVCIMAVWRLKKVRELAQCVFFGAQGLTNKEIAALTERSKTTIANNFRAIKALPPEKLEILFEMAKTFIEFP